MTDVRHGASDSTSLWITGLTEYGSASSRNRCRRCRYDVACRQWRELTKELCNLRRGWAGGNLTPLPRPVLSWRATALAWTGPFSRVALTSGRNQCTDRLDEPTSPSQSCSAITRTITNSGSLQTGKYVHSSRCFPRNHFFVIMWLYAILLEKQHICMETTHQKIAWTWNRRSSSFWSASNMTCACRFTPHINAVSEIPSTCHLRAPARTRSKRRCE